MVKFLGAVLLLVVAAFVGFKGYVWYEVSQALDKFRDSIATKAAFEHGWISSTLDGEVKVENIKVTPFALKETVKIDAVAFKVPQASDLIGLSDRLDHRDWPDGMEWRVEGAHVSLSSPVFQDLSKNPLSEALGTVACGNTHVLGAGDLRAMGYSQLGVSVTGGYRLDRINQTGKLYFSVNNEAMSQSSIEAVFRLPDGWQSRSHDWRAEPPQLDYLRLSVKDDSYQRRLTHYCTRTANLEPAQFVEQSVALWSDAMADLGVTVNDDFRQAYRQWLEGDRQLLVELNPQRNLDYGLLPFIQPKDALELLGTVIRVDDFVVSDLGIEFNKDRFMAAGARDEEPEPVISLPKKPEPPKPPQMGFKTTPVESLNQYIGHPVRVSTSTGKQYEGKLTVVEPNGIQVSTQVSGGQISYPVRKSDIENLEVYR